jgi:hypothetical protein
MLACARRESMVVESAMPTLPPMFRIRLKRLVALPIVSLGIGSMVMVVRGTKMRPSDMPWMNCGQNTSQ